MLDPEPEETCRRVCAGLVRGEGEWALEGNAATLLRHMVREQGLSGLASLALDHGRLVLPPDARSGIRNDWATAVHRCMLLDAECTRFGRIAMQRVSGTPRLSPPLLLKGAAVARRYPNPSVRTYVDIDLLVPADEVRDWARCLRQAGYWAPEPEVSAVAQRLREGAEFQNVLAPGCSIDLHSSLFVEGHARELGYAILANHSEPSPFPGILQVGVPAQVVVLALHLAHHGAADRRLIWYRDLIELGTAETLEAALALAREHGVEWALEDALREVDHLCKGTVGGLQDEPGRPFGMASVHRLQQPEYLRHIALVRELGVRAGARYALSRIDPRRFTGPDGSFDRSAARDWLGSAVRRARRTAWTRVLRRYR